MEDQEDSRHAPDTTEARDAPSTEAPEVGTTQADDLVPDTLADELDDAGTTQADSLLPSSLAQLREKLHAQGLVTRTIHIGVAPSDEVVLELDLPAGANTRTV